MHTVYFLLKRLFVFFKTDESVIPIQRAFRAHFMLQRNDAVLDRILNPEQYRYSKIISFKKWPVCLKWSVQMDKLWLGFYTKWHINLCGLFDDKAILVKEQ